MKRKSILLVLILTLMMPSMVFGTEGKSENGQASEKEHWGAQIMKAWHEKGLVSGFPDGSLRPDEQVTRAQFVKLLNGVFNYSSSAAIAGQAAEIEADSATGNAEATSVFAFSDVHAGDWHYSDIHAVATAGIIQGYPDGSFKPNAQVSRQDAAKMLAAAFKLSNSITQAGEQLALFTDHHTVQGYARPAVEQLLAEGALQGYSDGTIKPLKALTRAEAITLLDRLSGMIIQESGTYRDLVIDGSLIIQAADVVLENVNVTGNVYVTAGVAEGDVQLNGVEITGTLHINGGGTNSIYLTGATVGHIVVNKIGGKVRVVIRDKSHIDQLEVQHDAIIELDEDSFIALLAFLEGAEGSELKGTGKIKQLLNAAGIKLPAHYQEDKDGGSDNNGNGQGESGGGSGVTPTPSPTTPPVEDDWQLVWSDEFDGSGTNLDDNGVDLDKWGYQLGTGSQYGLDGWGNLEEQYYRKENIAVEDGLLKITAKSEQHEGKAYTSGRLYTGETFARTYGKFEARMKMPEGTGLWPAFWMMPQGSAYGEWAASGELDIMEARGRLPQEVGGTIHYGKFWPNNKYIGDEYHFPQGQSITDFHVYGVEWEPGEIRWYVDGELYLTLNNWDSWGEDQPAKYAFPAPFDKPFYMILNLAVGGTYDGGRKPDDAFEAAELLVDYVRVYDLVGRPYREVTSEPSVEVEPLPEQHKQAVAGNYVYDAAYTEPFTIITQDEDVFDSSYWNLVYLNQFGGTGSIEVEEIEVEDEEVVSFAKTTITQAGNQLHSIQLIQNVTVGKGRWYKLSFDAKSDANRNMAVKIGGGENRGWGVYSDNYTIALTDELQSYEQTFQMIADTDIAARLEFNMGLNANPIWIGNVKLEEVSAPDPYNENGDKEPLNDGNHIYNGSFDLGYIHRLTYWSLDTAEEAVAELSVDAEQRELRVDISSGGEQASDVALLQKGVSLIGGNTYELTFKARADQQRTIEAALRTAEGVVLGSAESMQLTEEMASYSVQFTLAGEAASYGQLALLLGGANGTIYMDDIKLVRTTDNNIGGVSLEQQFPLTNGDFSNGLMGWEPHVQGKYDGWDLITAADVVDGELVYAIEGSGGERWHVMLMQNGLKLAKNQTYIVTVDAKSSLERDMEIILETANYEGYVSERVTLSEEWQTFSYELPMTGDATLDFKLMLGTLEGDAPLGQHTVTIDNVRIEVKDARSKAFLASNGYFDDGLEGWLTHVQGAHDDNPSAASLSANDQALHASINHWGINPWDIMLFQDAVTVNKGETYVVSFVAKADAARAIEVIVENSTFTRSLNQPVELTEAAQRFSYEFTMTRDEPVQLKFLLGKPTDDASEATTHEIVIDNVQFELKGARAATGELARTEHDLD